MSIKNNLFRLSGKVQHYQWGGYSFLPELLGLPNEKREPFAEYWLGAHDKAPSEIQTDPVRQLDRFIAERPEVLSAPVRQKFGRLPYLLKVLDVKDMLSIQVHPTKEAAVIEFERENREGIPLDAANRNYKDNNHKPEMMLALSEFWLLHGFKTEEKIKEAIELVPEFRFMLPLFGNGDYRKLYITLMEMEQHEVNEICKPLLERVFLQHEEGTLQKDNPDFWAARAALTYNGPEKVDRGIFSVYLLNLVAMQPGEAIFQDAGILHAYLEGQNMELMANSDNVLRGGLTPKHIDVPELMKHVHFGPVIPAIITGTKLNKYEEIYKTPAPDFQLSRIRIPKEKTTALQVRGTEIFMVMQGALSLGERDAEPLVLHRGEAAVAFEGASPELSALEDAEIFRASVPLGNE